jgi:hypothetical protein
MTMRKRYPEDIEKLDEFLFQNYGYGIYECCSCAAGEIVRVHPVYEKGQERVPRPGMPPLPSLSPDLKLTPREQTILAKKNINRLERAKLNLIDAVFDYYKCYWRLPKEAFDRNSDEYNNWVQFILDGLNLHQVFKYMDSLSEGLNHDLKTSLKDEVWRARGGKIKLVYKIGCIFALAFRNDWPLVFHLLQWFYKNLSDTDYQEELALPPKEEGIKRLRIEFSKIMSNKKRSMSIESRRNGYFPPETASHPERYIRFEVPDNCKALFLDTMKKLDSHRRERDKKINLSFGGDRIEFQKSYIRILPHNDCLPLIKFPDIVEGSSRKVGAILHDVLRLEEAATFLGVSSSDLLEQCEKGLVPHMPPNHRQIMIYDFPGKPLSPIQEKYKKEQTELLKLDGTITFSRRRLMEWRRGPLKEKTTTVAKKPLGKKTAHAEESESTINFTERDVLNLKESVELEEQDGLDYAHKREQWLRENDSLSD